MNHKVFVAGASGAIGQRLVPLLCSAGHKVVGTTRTEQGAETLRALGSEAVIVDVFDAEALSRAVLAVQPKIIIHQLTGLSAWEAGCIEEAITENARVRTEGTRNLVKAALAAATRRLIAQSIAWVYASGALPHKETDPLDVEAQGTTAVTVSGVMALESAVLNSPPLEGVVLRYGQFYGPGTGHESPAGTSPIHVDAAAYAALLAIDHGALGSVFNIAEPNEFVATEKARGELGRHADFRLSMEKLPDL